MLKTFITHNSHSIFENISICGCVYLLDMPVLQQLMQKGPVPPAPDSSSTTLFSKYGFSWFQKHKVATSCKPKSSNMAPHKPVGDLTGHADTVAVCTQMLLQLCFSGESLWEISCHSFSVWMFLQIMVPHLASVKWNKVEPFTCPCVWGGDTWRGRGGALIIPCCATIPLLDVQGCCTLRSFWLCPCCCWVRCLWWCRTGDRRGRSRLRGEEGLERCHNFTRAVFILPVLTCPHDEHHHDDDELPRPQLGGLAHFLHRHFVWRSQRNTIKIQVIEWNTKHKYLMKSNWNVTFKQHWTLKHVRTFNIALSSFGSRKEFPC